VRERALHDEVSFINEAKREGLQQGPQEAREEVACNLMAINLLTDEQIAAASSLTLADVKAPRDR
jgi:hypothetical protein